MSRYWNTTETYDQPTVSTLRQNISHTQQKALKKGNHLEPVTITGKKIVTSWWGISWCENLERYADYESRLARGKRYIRSGTVVDLKVAKGKISARVQGSRKTPYKVQH